MAKKKTTKSSEETVEDNITPVEAEIVSSDSTATEPAAGEAKKKRRLKPAAPSIREQSEIAAAKAEKAGISDQPQRNAFVKLIRLPFLIVLWPLRLLWKYIIVPPFRFLGRYKFFRVIGYVIVPPYFRSAFSELRLVTWPGPRETFGLVVAVLIFSIVFGVLIAGVDYGLDKLFRSVILNK